MFSSIGLYPMPGRSIYYVGSPLFSEARIKVSGGDFVVQANGTSAENLYVQSATLNGAALDVPWVEHADVVAGGTLVLEMGPQPAQWGVVK